MAWATVMDMVIMDNLKSQIKCSLLRIGQVGGFYTLLFMTPAANARLWDIDLKPVMSVSQIYSDNLRLKSPALAESGFVTQILPFIHVRRDGVKSKFDLSYRLQGLIYEGIDINSRLYNQLQMSSKTELYDDSLYLDSSSTVGQINATAIGGYSTNNIAQSSTVGATTYRTFRISPYWKPNFNGYAEGELRIGYTSFGNGSTTNPLGAVTVNNIGNLNSNSLYQSLHLTTGSVFKSTGFNGRLSLMNQEQDYTSRANSNVRFTSANAEISYKLIDGVGVFLQSGYYDNQYPTAVSASNGVYVIPGLSWSNSHKLAVAGGYGLNSYFGHLAWSPSSRTTLQISYRNSKVGGYNVGGYNVGGYNSGAQGSLTNGSGAIAGFDYNAVSGAALGQGSFGYSPTGALGAGRPGSLWNARVMHRTRHFFITGNYYSTTTTIQQLLASTPTFTTPTDINGQPTGLPMANDRAIDMPNVDNSLMMMNTANLSMTWSKSRSSVQVGGYYHDINYSTSRQTQNIYGATASLNWKFTPLTQGTIMQYWQLSDSKNKASLINTNYSTQSLTTSVNITSKFSDKFHGYMDFRHTQVEPNNTAVSGLALGSYHNYIENRITAGISVNF